MNPRNKERLNSAGLFLLILSCFLALLWNSALLHADAAGMHIDSQAYLYTAESVLNGKVLYRDVFDHKGPAFYLFECAGLAMSPGAYWGLWLVEVVLLTLSFFPLLRHWQKKINPFTSFIALFFILAWMSRSLTIGDNIPELYATALSAIGIWCLIRLDESDEISGGICFAFGLLAAAIFLIKANLLILLVIPTIYVLGMKNKRRLLLKRLLSMKAGGILLLVIIMFYFLFHQALRNAFFAYWIFNVQYISNHKLTLWQSLNEVLIQNPNTVLVFVVLCGSTAVFFYRETRIKLMMLMTSLLLSVLILVALPGRGAESLHYMMPLCPLLVWILVESSRNFKNFSLIMLLCIGIYFTKPVIMGMLDSGGKRKNQSAVIEYLNTRSESNQSLGILGNHSLWYKQSGLQCNTKYFYTYPILSKSNSVLMDDFQKEFNRNPADWVIRQKQFDFDESMTTLLQPYTIVFEDDEAILFRRR